MENCNLYFYSFQQQKKNKQQHYSKALLFCIFNGKFTVISEKCGKPVSYRSLLDLYFPTVLNIFVL